MTDLPEQPPVPPVPPVAPGWSTEQPPAYGASGFQPPPPPGWGYQPPAPKPGVVPLRPLSVLEILDGAISTMRQYWRPMLGLAFAVSAALAAIGFVLSLFSVSSLTSLDQLDQQTVSGGDVVSALAPLLLGAFASAMVQFVGVVLLTGVLTAVVGQAVLGRELTIDDAWRRVRPLAWRLLGVALLAALAVGVGLVFCLLPGIILAVFFSLATAVLVLERSTVFTSISRSFSLVGSSFWRTFGILALVTVIYVIITTAVAIPFGIGSLLFPISDGAGNVNETAFVVNQAISSVGSVISGTIGYPFIAASIVLTYIDRRMRREGLDIELARAAANPS